MTPTRQFIEDAIAGGWENDKYPRLEATPNGVTPYLHIEAVLLDPLAWQAVGKTRGWETFHFNDRVEVRGWANMQHNLVSYLQDGKTIDEALAGLGERHDG